MTRRNEPTISAAQLMFLLLTSRSLSLLLRPAVYDEGISALETLLGCAMAALFVFATERTVLSSLPIVGNSPGRAFSLFALVLLLGAGVRALVSFTSFFREMNASPIPSALTMALLALVALYAIGRGIEGIARFALVVFVGMAAAVSLTTALGVPSAELSNLTMLDGGSLHNIVTVFLTETFLCSELVIFFVMARFVGDKSALGGCYRVFQGVRLCATAAFAVFEQAVFGNFSGTQQYPFFTLAVIGEFSVFQNLDVLYLFVWCIVTVLKLSLMAAALTAVLRDFFPVGASGWLRCAACAAVFGLSLALLYAGGDVVLLCEIAVMAITAMLCAAALVTPGRRANAGAENRKGGLQRRWK